MENKADKGPCLTKISIACVCVLGVDRPRTGKQFRVVISAVKTKIQSDLVRLHFKQIPLVTCVEDELKEIES